MPGHPQPCDLMSPASPQVVLSEVLGVRAPASGSWGPWQPLLEGARLSSRSPSLGTSPGHLQEMLLARLRAAHPLAHRAEGRDGGAPLGLRWLCAGAQPPNSAPAPQLGFMMCVRTPGRPLQSASSPLSLRGSPSAGHRLWRTWLLFSGLSLLEIWERGQHPISAGCMQAGWAQGVLMEVAASRQRNK